MNENAETEHGGGQAPGPLGQTDSFPTDAELSRSLMESARKGVLSTLTPDSYPYGSLVSHVTSEGGDPIILISDLAEHTQNVRLENRASFLVNTASSIEGDPLSDARLTLVGKMELLDDPGALGDLYLSKHPYAAGYADFKDFNYWKLVVERCRFVGGFGHMSWMDGTAYSQADADPFSPNAEHAIEHMNDDHAGANLKFVQELGGIPDASEAQMVAVDRYGMTFQVPTEEGVRFSRVAFPEIATHASQLEPFVIGLLRSLPQDA